MVKGSHRGVAASDGCCGGKSIDIPASVLAVRLTRQARKTPNTRPIRHNIFHKYNTHLEINVTT
jgi:hypothetical protein